MCSIYNLNNAKEFPYVRKRITVSLDAEVYQRLKKQGNFGDSFSDVVSHILDERDAMKRGRSK